MKKFFPIAFLALAFTSCASITADFTWSPSQPKAGTSIQFENLSNDGEYFNWSFGDGSTSLLVSPKKTYTKAGTYNVTLRVDSTNRFSCTKQITIYDTVPYFTLTDSTGWHYYTKNTIKPTIYNPSGLAEKLEWEFPTTAHGEYIGEDGKSTRTDKESITAYFSEFGKPVTIRCHISLIQNSKVKSTFDIDTTFVVQDTPARSVLIGSSDGTLYRQRIYELGFEAPVEVMGSPWTSTSQQLAVADNQIRVYDQPACNYLGTDYYAADYNSSATAICCTQGKVWCATPDGIYCYDATTKAETAHILTGIAISNLALDAINQKVYYISNSQLYCANYDGSAPTLASTIAADGPLCIDNLSNRIFWSSGDVVHMATLATNSYNQVGNTDVFTQGISVRALTLDLNKK